MKFQFVEGTGSEGPKGDAMHKRVLDSVIGRMEYLKPTRPQRGPEALRLEPEDLDRTLVEHAGPPLVFNRFSLDRVMQDLERRGILERIRERGYGQLRGEVVSESYFENRFRLLGAHPDLESPGLLIDCRTHQSEVEGTCPWHGEGEPSVYRWRVLVLDWISFQDPARALPLGLTPLPGQTHPGLGVFRDTLDLTLAYVRELELDAVINVPEYFHNAVLYSSHFKFFDPRREGRLQAMRRDLLARGLAESSQALQDGKVLLLPDERPIRWTAAEQVHALEPDLARYFQHPRYLEMVEHELTNSRYCYAE